MASVQSPVVQSINSKSRFSKAKERLNGGNESTSYPYIPLGFIMATTTFQGSFIGAQAILEIFFSRFVFVCAGLKAKMLGTVAVNVFIALNQFTSFTGGYLADFILGNFHTQNLSNILGSVGVSLVFFGSWQYTMHPPECCIKDANESSNQPINCHTVNDQKILSFLSIGIPADVAVTMIIIGCVLFAIGYGQTNAIQSVFVGDQFPEEQLQAKEKSFSWFYLFQNLGSLFSESGIPIARQSIGFVIAFLIIAGFYWLGTIVFAIGMCFYIRKGRASHTCYSKFKKNTESQPLLSSDSGISDRKQFLRVCCVYLPLIGFWALFFQQNSTWVLQGAMMNCYIGNLHLPPDMMPSINDIMVIILIPILEYLVYPHLRRTMNLHIKPLQKIVAGMVCVTVSFVLAALLQLYITQPLVSCRGRVSILWQIPQLLLVSFAEVFVAVTGLEFAYSQSPPHLRNLVKALWCITQALGAALNAAIALIDLHLVYEFILFAGLMSVIVCVFLAINWNYKYT